MFKLNDRVFVASVFRKLWCSVHSELQNSRSTPLLIKNSYIEQHVTHIGELTIQ